MAAAVTPIYLLPTAQLNGETMADLLTQDEAAKFLRLPPRTLETWRVRGGGPRYIKISRRSVRYRRADLDAWVASRARDHTAQPEPRPSPCRPLLFAHIPWLPLRRASAKPPAALLAGMWSDGR
jgi:excisionase family DNA binding protein